MDSLEIVRQVFKDIIIAGHVNLPSGPEQLRGELGLRSVRCVENIWVED